MIRRITAIFFVAFVCAAFQFPTTGEYEHVTDYRDKVQESEIENARTADPIRKASENKRPWMPGSESFLDMENYVTPGFDSWEMPGFGDFDPWDIAPAPLIGPNDVYLPIWHMAGCGFSTLSNITDCERWYSFNFRFIHGVVVKVKVSGPVLDYTFSSGSPSSVDFYPLPNATEGSEVCVEAWTRSLKKGQIDGYCTKCVKLYCADCVCDGYTPHLYASGTTIVPGGSITMYADSGGLACPPYKWTVSGLGYTISPSTTQNDTVTVTLTSAAGV